MSSFLSQGEVGGINRIKAPQNPAKNFLFVLIWVQPVFKGYQQTTKVVLKELKTTHGVIGLGSQPQSVPTTAVLPVILTTNKHGTCIVYALFAIQWSNFFRIISEFRILRMNYQSSCSFASYFDCQQTWHLFCLCIVRNTMGESFQDYT